MRIGCSPPWRGEVADSAERTVRLGELGWGKVAEALSAGSRSLISGYRRYISPLLGRHCRFYPSCSQYAYEAIAKHGMARGSLLAVKRLAKCHPFHPGGVDHVPDVTPRTEC